MKRSVVLISVLALLMTLGGSPVAAEHVSGQAPSSDGSAKDPVLEPVDPDRVTTAPAERSVTFVKEAQNDPGTGLYLVQLVDEPVAAYEGGVAGLAATAPDDEGEQLDPSSAAAQSYADYLEEVQAEVIADVARRLGKARLDVPYTYQFANNGFAVELTPDEAAVVAEMPEVAFVQADELRELHTDRGPSWIGAPSLWDGTATPPGLPGSRGEGMIVGVIDTGITPANPSFAAVSPVDGYQHVNPRGRFYGVCDPTDPNHDPTFPCNAKLIGAYGYDTGPWGATAHDTDGHGSHTAGTAAGNLVNATAVSNDGSGTTYTAQISGVAPRANIISYQACCALSALTAAINQAVADAVDAINYSIGSAGATPSMWTDFDTLGYLNARRAGIFVATSAGNAGPGDATVGSPGDAPWLTAVAASSHDRHLDNDLVDLSGGATPAPGDIRGKSFSGGHGPARIVDAADYGDGFCREPFPAGTFPAGSIVVCQRGIAGRVAMGTHVEAGGAGGLVIVNDPPNNLTLMGDNHVLPAAHISYPDGIALRAWLASGENHTGTITGVNPTVDPSRADRLVAFSSRGPNRAIETITPSLTAPGIDILAPYGASVGNPGRSEWSFISGTSMASPHIAGAGALMKAVQPTWSIAEIQSALMLTALPVVDSTDHVTPATPFGEGNGRVDLTRAARTGIVMHETYENYVAANPAEGGDPKTLNLPSMHNAQCPGTCSWTRTVRSTVAGPVTWTASTTSPEITVTPSSFTLDGVGAEQTITVTIDVSELGDGVTGFGRLTLTPSDTALPVLGMPVAATSTTGILPSRVTIDTRRDAGSHLIEDLLAIEVTDLDLRVRGLVRGARSAGELSQDPTRGAPFDDLDDVFFTTVQVPENAVRLVAEIGETPMPDADLYVGSGSVPSAETLLCVDGNPTSAEFCELEEPAAGTYWVLVQNWQGTEDQPDPFELFIGVVPSADLGNAYAEGPEAVPPLEPFDVRFFWDIPEMEAGDRWYGDLVLGVDPTSPGSIGSIPIHLVRHADDVTKAVDVDTAEPGDTLTYEITVAPNVTAEDLAYEITDTIPDGLTYVPGSATNGATVTDGVLHWTGVMETPVGAEGNYVMTTNATDPACDTPVGGGWLDLQALGISPNPGIDGGDATYSAFTTGAPFRFYDQEHTGLGLAPAGVVTAGAANLSGAWWIPQTLPDPTPPNSVIAPLWGDFQVVYNAATNSGVRLVTLGGTGPDGWAVIDYDRVQLYGGSSDTWSMQLWTRRSPSPATPDIVVAYNNLGALTLPMTVGVENQLGTIGAALVNNQPAAGLITSSTIVCFDYEGPSFEPEVITYQVTVDDDAFNGVVTNQVVHDTDNPGSKPAVAAVDVLITGGTEPPMTFPILRAELDALVAADGIRPNLEAKIRRAFDQAELWLTLEKQRPIAYTHLERAVHLLLWQAEVIERGNPDQGDAAGLRALAASIQRMIEQIRP